MSTAEPPDGARKGVPPVAPDRPYVDGTAHTPAELRAEAAELADPERQAVDEAREQLAATVGELATRLDPRTRARAAAGSLRAWATRPPVLAGAAAAVLLLVLRRARRSG
jgi:uncharacterized protein DUF3618